MVGFALVADFIVFEAIRCAPGDYDAADLAWGCALVVVASLAGLLLSVAGAIRGRRDPVALRRSG